MTLLTWDSLQRNCTLHKFPTLGFWLSFPKKKLIHPCSHFWQSGNQELNEQPQNVDIGLLEDCREGHRSCTMERNDERAWETIQALSAANPTLINTLHCCTDCLLQCYICDFVTVHCPACRPSVLTVHCIVLWNAKCIESSAAQCSALQCVWDNASPSRVRSAWFGSIVVPAPSIIVQNWDRTRNSPFAIFTLDAVWYWELSPWKYKTKNWG